MLTSRPESRRFVEGIDNPSHRQSVVAGYERTFVLQNRADEIRHG